MSLLRYRLVTYFLMWAALPNLLLAQDWPQWGGSSLRNNTPFGTNIPTFWNVGDFDRRTGRWIPDEAENIKWVARLGSQTYGNPVIADGRIYVGTNNGAGYLERYPPKVDLGCMLCFREADGAFQWQYSSEKLATGRVHDWPLQGICSAPLVEGKRMWFVSNRGEVVCLDTEGFYDDEDDGMKDVLPAADLREADVVWKFDMMKKLGVSQHNMANCYITSWGNRLFVCTSNGVDSSHLNIPAPDAPSFVALDKHSGRVLWTDNSPGMNILHGQWSAPAVAELGGVPQVIFPAGDGWVYSFRADRWKQGKPELLWKFDGNPKESKWILGGRGTRNNIIAIPVIYDGLVYVVMGQDPEHGEGAGHLWCIDPTKRGDVSPELAMKIEGDERVAIQHRRYQAVTKEDGEIAVANLTSAVVWHYDRVDHNGDGQFSFEEEFHRGLGSVAIKNDLLFVTDFSGIVHCLNAKTGQVHWTCDLLAASWGSPLIVADHVYIGDEDGDIAVFPLSADITEAAALADADIEPGGIRSFVYHSVEPNMGNSVYSTPVVANNVLYIANKSHLFAIAEPVEPPTTDDVSEGGVQ